MRRAGVGIFNKLEICLACTATSKEEVSATSAGRNRKCDNVRIEAVFSMLVDDLAFDCRLPHYIGSGTLGS